ncbi:hypothetical protein [Nostoc sp. UHCC 0251]|uniref:hypothetical protein n=1 Tax=Nostoc sp. UHCC 0251 TaxID=3110240 RepID=UPI002B216539|nr:hypothetical protein [Nostoc sp. UHCC 0251]MEA5626196.1 hypothetical protein [Nostoc sp. UHCC 0251]
MVKQIIRDFPRLDIQLIVCDRIIGTNLKVSNLANALSFAKYEVYRLWIYMEGQNYKSDRTN